MGGMRVTAIAKIGSSDTTRVDVYYDEDNFYGEKLVRFLS